MVPERAEVLITGAGIIGLTLARELVRRGGEGIVILEKEPVLGLHASGRNSGVLHAGIYYTADSLKGRACVRGNRLMREYCLEHGLPLLDGGKVIVTRSESELPILQELFARGEANGAKVEFIDEKQLAKIEPNAKTVGQALWSHFTAQVDPKAVLECLHRELAATGKVKIVFGCKFTGLSGSVTARTTRGSIRFNRFVNSAGAHCDTVARAFGVGRRYRLIPFKGIYRKLKPSAAYTVNSNIYPVPDIRNPFLGVHFTRNVHGEVYLGPTAIPAFGRENYGILRGMGWEAFPLLLYEAAMFFKNPKFRSLALSEPRKYSASYFFKDAKMLVKKLRLDDIAPSPKAGIRAQLVDWRTKEMVMDFLVTPDGDALHVLNPISPAFTCAMDLAQKMGRDYF